MKHTFTRVACVLAMFVILFASCKKDTASNKPVQGINYAGLSSTIALNLINSLNGKDGGQSISNGIKAPLSLTPQHKGPAIFSMTSACGFTIDTAWNYNATAADTAKTFAGNFKFIYTCSANSVNGYILHDSITNTENSAKFSNTFIVSQNYTVVALDQTYKLVSMNGSIQTVSKNIILNAGTIAGYHNLFAFYVLNGLQVNFASGAADITTGTATFTMIKGDLDPAGSQAASALTLTGKIEFLGNHSARLTIDPGHVYTVNLLTGTATAN
jgi:hypothetical protein